MKVSDLTDQLLDYWVARAAGMTAGMMTVSALRTELTEEKRSATREIDSLPPGKERGFAGAMLVLTEVNLADLQGVVCDGDLRAVRNGGIFEPSSDWSQGGPIIDRMRITVAPSTEDPSWTAEMWSDRIQSQGYFTVGGPTPLTAAMRAFVASVYGDTVPEAPSGALLKTDNQSSSPHE